MEDQNEYLPRIRSKSMPRYGAGASRSIAKLTKLGFDPMEELVATYRSLVKEVLRWEALRDGNVRDILPDGSTKKYSHIAHSKCYEQMINVCNILMRYNYGRVPDEVIEPDEDELPPIVIQLRSTNDITLPIQTDNRVSVQ